MTGIPYFNYPAFDAEAKRLRALGHEVFNPADHDQEVFGADISNPTGDAAQATVEYGFDRAAALKADLSWICDNAEAIVLLPGWEKSSGARTELALADALGRAVYGPGMSELPPSAARDVLAERRRQVDGEGFGVEHDDINAFGEIAVAAGCYALAAHAQPAATPESPLIHNYWPWNFQWWKPSTPRRNLVKAGALILAEIERLDRSNVA